ncbi:MAG TPA: hypothetical protein PKE37_16395 [Thiomonas arsenitoxydans]|uniref:hypothetical protein n=1 Tax=Thiomonas arsenitoxydans (strain DSM 22701 / CIP 110005 / 3As) TaxID=426114 RepID=UPI002C46B326|nr:hypothetical protein [Thiomonas arsenitoxydans]HML83335.1 hypothetical protein [Thiomonas arsenitoxydans]
MTLDEILSDLYLRLHTADEARDLIDGIMWREINAHVAAEREACAKVCEEHARESWDHEGGALVCADRIRARGEK